jgi:hypothetical protein
MTGESVDQVAAGEFGGKLRGSPLDTGVVIVYCCHLAPKQSVQGRKPTRAEISHRI